MTQSTDTTPAGETTTHYTSYHVYRRLAGLGALVPAEPAPRVSLRATTSDSVSGDSASHPDTERAGTGAGAVDAADVTAGLTRTVEAMEGTGATVLGFYDAAAFRAGDDIILWLMAEKPEHLQQAVRLFETSVEAELLEPVWSAVGVHRQHEFSRGHRPSFMDPEEFPRREWITIYPFVRSYDWYLLKDEDRRRILREHGEMGRKYPQVGANTTAAFALGDYEWLLSFEADDLHDLVDMMRDLRYTEARLHVRDELPFHVGRRLHALEDLAQILF